MFGRYFNKILFLLSIVVCTILSCSKQDEVVLIDSQGYAIINGAIQYNQKQIQLIGVNAFQSFGVGSSDIKTWGLDITREFIGNVNENPITGAPILDSNGKYLHALQAIVDENRANNLITILCPFGWDGTNATLFTGKRPTETFWWQEYKTILKLWAIHFKNQNDVWIEVWNEPYNFNRTDGFTNQVWLNDMNTLYSIVRNESNTIILIPCAEQGQDESVLLQVGNTFLTNKTNVLFDVHAYEKWLLQSNSEIDTRLANIKLQTLPVIFGETAPVNAGVLMNPKYFLNEIHSKGLSVCAWVWKYDENDQDALLTQAGLPNNINNNNWGTLFRTIVIQDRNPN